MTEIREKLNIKYFKGSFITTPPTKEFIGEYFTQKKNIKISRLGFWVWCTFGVEVGSSKSRSAVTGE